MGSPNVKDFLAKNALHELILTFLGIIFGGDIQATAEGVGATLRESRAVGGSSREQRSSASLHCAAAINCPLLLRTIRLCYFLLVNSRVELAAIGAKDQEWAKDSLPLLCKNL